MMMTIEQVVRVVQVSFPQVYLACHTRHQRKKSTEHALSARDSAILAHLDIEQPTQPSRLARHLGVSRSTVSEALRNLTSLGFVERARDKADARSTSVLLTEKGAGAVGDTSVLETDRLRDAIEMATPQDRAAIARGMALLASACTRLADARKENTV